MPRRLRDQCALEPAPDAHCVLSVEADGGEQLAGRREGHAAHAERVRQEERGECARLARASARLPHEDARRLADLPAGHHVLEARVPVHRQTQDVVRVAYVERLRAFTHRVQYDIQVRVIYSSILDK